MARNTAPDADCAMLEHDQHPSRAAPHIDSNPVNDNEEVHQSGHWELLQKIEKNEGPVAGVDVGPTS